MLSAEVRYIASLGACSLRSVWSVLVGVKGIREKVEGIWRKIIIEIKWRTFSLHAQLLLPE